MTEAKKESVFPQAGLLRTVEELQRRLPPRGLFEGEEWMWAPEPFPLPRWVAEELERMGRILARFVWACDVLYKWSCRGRAPGWIARYLDQGKPESIITLGKEKAVHGELPRVIRPDLILGADRFWITELDSIPGGIGLTDWLQSQYAALGLGDPEKIIGGPEGMRRGFEALFPKDRDLVIVVSEESRMYRPEMEWLAEQLSVETWVVDGEWKVPEDELSIYRFFELFDVDSVPCAWEVFDHVLAGKKWMTPPPKAYLEEKAWLALLWNPHLRDLWRQLLRGAYYQWLLEHVPRGWILDPEPVPPNAAIPGLEIRGWDELLEHPELRRGLVMKRSGFHPAAWGSRSVVVGSDVSSEQWGAALKQALDEFGSGLWVIQEYKKPALYPYRFVDFTRQLIIESRGRVRLCPYYFVTSPGEHAQVKLGGVLATICPADKKIIHGMRDAVMAPCCME